MAGRSLIAALLLALGGCATATPAQPAGEHGGICPALVLRAGGASGDDASRAAMAEIDERAWEYSRNDARLNAGWTPAEFAHQYATIRNTDWLYTSNGRPLEFSRTYIQTVTERAAR